MWPTSDGWAAAVATSGRYATRAFLLTPKLEVIEQLRVIGGDCRVEYGTPIQRTVSGLEVEAAAGVLAPSRRWYPILIECGERVGSSMEWVPVITAYPDDPRQKLMPGGSTLTMNGRDGLRLLADYGFARTYTYPADMRIRDFVRQILIDAGWGDDDGLYDLDDDGQTLGIDHTYEIERNGLDVVWSVAGDFNLGFWADPLRRAVLRPLADPNTAPIAKTYGRGTDVRVTAFEKTWRDLMKNHWLVIGEDATGRSVRAEKRNMNRLSPAYNPPPGHPDYPGPLGDRLDVYRSLAVVTQAQADALCVSRAYATGLVDEQVDLEGPPDPALAAGDIVNITEPTTGTSGRHRLAGFTVPFKPAAQPLLAQRVEALA